MSSRSAPLSLAICIRRSWVSFPLPRLSFKFQVSMAETSTPFFRTRRISSFLVLRVDRTPSTASTGFTFAFIFFRISAYDCSSLAETLIASPGLAGGEHLGAFFVPPSFLCPSHPGWRPEMADFF